MAAFNGSTSMRGDFRCSLCQQRNVFHCEHDTPYRDQYLGSTDQERLQSNATSGRREAQTNATTASSGRDAYRNANNHSSTSNHATTSNGAGGGRVVDTRNQQGSKLKQNTTDKAKAEEEQKKKKSCVIL